jgi:hypothetical protein
MVRDLHMTKHTTSSTKFKGTRPPPPHLAGDNTSREAGKADRSVADQSHDTDAGGTLRPEQRRLQRVL